MITGVSVIVCCYNSARRLPETLRHLARQEVSETIAWEVVIVDNASTDGTAEIAIKEWQNVSGAVPLRVIAQPVAGLSFAREKGIDAAAYEFLLFCDDDNWLSPTYLARGYEILKSQPDVALVGGWGEPVCEVTPPNWFRDFAGPYGTGPQMGSTGIASPLTTFYGAGTVIRKSDYDQLISNGFRFLLSGRQGNKLTTGEDRELCYALTLCGKKLYYDSELKFQHFIPKERSTFEYYKRMTKNCIPASLILKAYHLHVLNRVQKRSQVKNSYLWIMVMAILSQIRRFRTESWLNLKNGYFKHLHLEISLLIQTCWFWLTSSKEFRRTYQTIEHARFLQS